MARRVDTDCLQNKKSDIGIECNISISTPDIVEPYKIPPELISNSGGTRPSLSVAHDPNFFNLYCY